MKESRAFFASIAAGVILAVLVGAAITLSYPGTTSVATTPELTQTSTQLSSATTTVLTTPLPTTATVTESSTAASTTTTVASSTALPCSSPGVQCGSFQIVSASLVTTPGATFNPYNLTLTLDNTGNVAIGSFEVFLNYNVNSSSLFGGHLPAGQQMPISISLQSTQILVAPGQTYIVQVEGFLIGSGHITANLWETIEVVAS